MQPEDLERAGGEGRGAIGMAAGSAAGNLGDPAFQLLPLVLASLRSKPFEGARDRVEAVDTGAALPGAGGGQIPHRPRCLADAARAPRQDDDRSGAEPRAPWPQVGLKQGRIGGLALAEPAAEETAYEEGADVLCHSSRLADELSEGSPERDLVDAGLCDRAGDRHQRCPRFGRRPDRAEPLWPETGNQGKLRQRLDVLHKRRRPANTALEWPRGREGGLGNPAVQELNERRLFSGDESVGHGDSPQTNSFVQPGAPLVDRCRERFDTLPVGSRHGHDRLARAEGLRGGRGSVEDQVREVPDQDLVLAADGLTLGPVRDHDGTPALRCDRAKLRGRGEAGSAAALQPARLDECTQVDRSGVREAAVDGEVLIQCRGSFGRGDPRQEPGQCRRRTAGTWPRTAAPKATPTSPLLSLERAKRPLSCPSNDFGSVVERATVPRAAEEEEAWRLRMFAGVPARAAQPERPGPPRYQATARTASTTAAAPAPARSRSGPVERSRRSATAAPTALAQAIATITNQPNRESLPLPRPCTRANGHDA